MLSNSESSQLPESYPFLYRGITTVELHRRADHTINSAILGKIKQGSIVNVYEEYLSEDNTDSDGFYWRRIDNNIWIADSPKPYSNGHWLKKMSGDLPVGPTPSEQTISVKSDLGDVLYIRDCAGFSSNIIGCLCPCAS